MAPRGHAWAGCPASEGPPLRVAMGVLEPHSFRGVPHILIGDSALPGAQFRGCPAYSAWVTAGTVPCPKGTAPALSTRITRAPRPANPHPRLRPAPPIPARSGAPRPPSLGPIPTRSFNPAPPTRLRSDQSRPALSIRPDCRPALRCRHSRSPAAPMPPLCRAAGVPVPLPQPGEGGWVQFRSEAAPAFPFKPPEPGSTGGPSDSTPPRSREKGPDGAPRERRGGGIAAAGRAGRGSGEGAGPD